MADLEQQVMQLTQDLYVLKHTVIAWKTVEERIKESNTVPEDAMLKTEDNRGNNEIHDFIMNENWELQDIVVWRTD